MKRIEAFVKPFTVESVKDALHGAGVSTIRIIEARELSRHEKYAEVYRGTEYEVDVSPCVQMVVHVEDEDADRIIDLLVESARTETDGQGHIFVSSLERVLNLDSGQSV